MISVSLRRVQRHLFTYTWIELPSVIGWRTIEDTERMIEIAKTKRRAIVIGGGLLGLECARGLMDRVWM